MPPRAVRSHRKASGGWTARILFAKGHDFSRAASESAWMRALAPESSRQLRRKRQRLKPALTAAFFGTTEVVPLRKETARRIKSDAFAKTRAPNQLVPFRKNPKRQIKIAPFRESVAS
jgi:hypothetical protein